MSKFEPGIIVWALACSMIDLAKAGSDGSDQGAVAMIEHWLEACSMTPPATARPTRISEEDCGGTVA
jgi:hypothetical protein